MPALPRPLRLVLLLALGWWAAAGVSAQSWTPAGNFLGRLSETERLATGLHELSDQERANLENLIAYEIASARAGNVTGFAGTFTSRRSAAELDATGLDRLGDDQRDRLDQHIAGYLADTPRVPYLSRHDRNRLRPPGASDEPVESRGPRLDVHGEVSITVGTAGGESFYGGSMTTVISDPAGRFSAAISYGTMRGGVPYSDTYYDRRDPRFRAPGNLPLPPRP